MTENDYEARDSGNGAPWFELMCLVCAGVTVILFCLILWDWIK